jgi:hypothetical protein
MAPELSEFYPVTPGGNDWDTLRLRSSRSTSDGTPRDKFSTLNSYTNYR